MKQRDVGALPNGVEVRSRNVKSVMSRVGVRERFVA